MNPQRNLQDISYETINSDFSYGKYGEFRVILMTKNGYVNATKLCALEGKMFKNWMKNACSQNLVDVVDKKILESSSARNLSDDKSLVTITGGKEIEIRGTYVHPLLVPHIACWCSPDFAVKVSEIVNNFIVREYELEIKSSKQLIGEQRDKIDLLIEQNKRLLEKNDQLLEKNDELLEDSKHTKNLLESAHGKLDNMQDTLLETQGELVDTKYEVIETNHRLDTVQEKLEIAVEDRVPKINIPSKIEMFILFKLGNIDKTKYDYYVIRSQRTNIVGACNKVKRKYINAKELLSIEYNPNSKNLYNRVKLHYGKKRMNSYYNWFSMKDKTSESDLVKEIQDLNNDKYNV